MKPTVTLTPDWQRQPAPLKKSWAGVGNIDQFRWLVREDVRRQLAMARDELGLRYVRACAMFSPELRVRGHALRDWRVPESSRALQTNWQIVDYCLEGLVDLGLKPVYTTCFTPPDMSSGASVCWPDRNPVDPPGNLDAWTAFVEQAVSHHIRRFGRQEVRSWLFECWNEPNLEGFFRGSKEDFFRLWSATWRGVKGADPELRIGGPSTARGEWIPEFLEWTARDGTPPDYLITHVYNNDSEAQPLSPFDGPASHRVKDSPHFATGVIRGVRSAAEALGWKGVIHWNEWGRSWFPHDPLKETPLEAAFIVKTMAEVSQEADSFAFWCLSDIYDQCGYSSSEFDANYGMLSLHGLRKPAWHAHDMLMRLMGGRHPVAGGDDLTGAIATSEGGLLAVAAYAYPQSIENPPERLLCRIPLPGQIRQVRLARIGPEENNIIAQWHSIGAPPYPTRSELDALRASNALAFGGRVELRDGMAEFELDRPGAALLLAESA